MGNGRPLSRQQPPYKLWLQHYLAPGDVVVMTSAVESLKALYGNRYRIAVHTTCMPIWDHNPHVERLHSGECAVIQVHYPMIQRCGQLYKGRLPHMMDGFHEHLGAVLGIDLPRQVKTPKLYLSPEEQKTRIVDSDRPIITIVAGTKRDYTAKGRGRGAYQEVVDALRNEFCFVQVGQADHLHQPLDHAINLIGKTTPRELFTLIHQSVGGIGPSTFLQHASAALDRPYVCVSGGREPLNWVAGSDGDYPLQVTLQTSPGCLPCAKPGGCWRSRTVALGDGDTKDTSLCALPVVNDYGETVPQCLHDITPEDMILAIRKATNTWAKVLPEPIQCQPTPAPRKRSRSRAKKK